MAKQYALEVMQKKFLCVREHLPRLREERANLERLSIVSRESEKLTRCVEYMIKLGEFDGGQFVVFFDVSTRLIECLPAKSSLLEHSLKEEIFFQELQEEKWNKLKLGALDETEKLVDELLDSLRSRPFRCGFDGVGVEALIRELELSKQIMAGNLQSYIEIPEPHIVFQKDIQEKLIRFLQSLKRIFEKIF